MNILSMESLSRQDIENIFSSAKRFLPKKPDKVSTFTTLNGKIAALLFFEPSTRTRNSFKIAADRLSAITLAPELDLSSLVKGESILDTIRTFEAMGVSIFVIRHPQNGLPAWVAEQSPNSTIINAGDGHHQHPTQALIDLFTIQQHKNNWETLRVAIIGDILHSRVTHSLTDGLLTMGVPEIRLIGPPSLLPQQVKDQRMTLCHSIEEGLSGCDVIVTLRLQKERMKKEDAPNPAQFHAEYGLNKSRLALAQPDVIVMHPGPMNRGIEITSDVADGEHAVILEQVRNGVAVRMAILAQATH